MSQPPASTDFKARVARLQPCDCKLRNWTDPHLTIELDHIPLQRGEATAISYVWGEFDRRDVPIGHPPGKSDDIIRMNLGMEWIIQDVIHRLAEIAADKPIWMDQLCIPQNDEEIRKILASIATIYKSFDVAVLLPGHPCACLPLIVKELEARAAEEGKDRNSDEANDIEGVEDDFCLNVCPLSSWMNRLWTFQELGFSQSVHCVWVSKNVAKRISLRGAPTVVFKPEDVRLVKAIAETDLQPYAAICFRRTLSTYLEVGMEEWKAVSTAWLYLVKLSRRHLAHILTEIWGFGELVLKSGWITSIKAFNCLTLYRFLSGEVVLKNENHIMELDSVWSFYGRILQLRRDEFRPGRKATHARDYIFAVFTEVDGYSPPPNYKNEEVPMLLQHALDWYRRESHNFVMLSTAPQGLFMSDTAESFLWRPAYYNSPDNIRTANDVYETLTIPVVKLIKVKGHDVVPLSYHIAGCIPLSVTTKGWESFHGDFAEPDSVPNVAAQLKNTIRSWKFSCRVRIELAFHEDIEKYASGQSASDLTWRLLCCLDLFEWENIPKDYLGIPFSMMELHLAFYELVCRALFLDVDFCREKGVKLMFSPPTEYRQHWRVGLCRGDIKLGGEQAHDSDHIMTHQSLTVGFKYVQFEAERVDDHDGMPAYRVWNLG